MTEPTLPERLRRLDQDFNVACDEYVHEVLGRAADALEQMERDLEIARLNTVIFPCREIVKGTND